MFGQIQTSQTGGRPFRDTYPYGECSLIEQIIYLSGHTARTVQMSKRKWGDEEGRIIKIIFPTQIFILKTISGQGKFFVCFDGGLEMRKNCLGE